MYLKNIACLRTYKYALVLCRRAKINTSGDQPLLVYKFNSQPK